MAEETPSTQPAPAPAPRPAPAPAPAPTPSKKEPPKKGAIPKKKGGWFQKIPREIFLTPGGVVIFLVVIIVEILGVLVPIPIIGFLIQLPFVIILYILLMTIGGLSFKSLIMVPVIEFFFPFLPTWLIRILI